MGKECAYQGGGYKKVNFSISFVEVAKELGLTLPVFYSVFYPKLSVQFKNILNCIPSSIEIPTWSHDLLSNQSFTKQGISLDWNAHMMPLDSYSKIKNRWNRFDVTKKKIILECDKIIRNIFPNIDRMSVEKRSRLMPYCGLNMDFFADVGFVQKFTGYKGNQSDKLTLKVRLYKVREDLKPTEKNIYCDHVNIITNNIKNIVSFKPKQMDTIKFSADVVHYKGTHIHNAGLINIIINKIWRSE